MVNVAAEQLVIMRAAASTLGNVRTAFISASPDVSGTILEGNVGMLGSAVIDLQAEVNQAIWTQLIAAHVPSHRNLALGY